MKTHKLSAEKREVIGKKVKQLRKTGVLPANIYGKSVASRSISLTLSDFQKIYDEVGETGLIELSVKGDKTPHHVLIHSVQTHPVTEEYLHADLHEVALKDKIQVPVPLTFIGESPAATQKKGVLLHLLDEVEVEALPTDLPEEIEVDQATLTEVDDQITVGDLKVPANVTLVTNKDEVVARINPLEKEEAPAPAAAPAEGEAAPVAEGEEAALVTEGQTPPPKAEAKKE